MQRPLAFPLILLAWLLALASPAALAYSYAAAGKEPLIDGRETLLGAATRGDWAAAATAFETMREEVVYLDGHHDKGLLAAFEKPLQARDANALGQVLTRAFALEIDRRLGAASEHLKDYQTARGMVLKSNRLFQATAGDFAPAQRAAIEAGLQAALAAVGNPGVFGVGAKPADPAALEQARQTVKTALGL